MFNRQKITKVAYLLLVGLLISIHMACSYPPQEIPPFRIKEIQSSAITIRLFDKGGNQIHETSGFFINEGRDVLSANCAFLQTTTRAEIVTSQGGIYPVKDIVEPNNPTWDDAAILSVDLPASTIKPIFLTSNLPSEGERIRVIDSRHFEYGSVTRSSTGSLAITFPIESWTFAEGAAVVNMNGEVFGVIGCENPSDVRPPYTRIVIGVLTKDNISKLAHVEARAFKERYESKPAHLKGPTSAEEYDTVQLRFQKEQKEQKDSMRDWSPSDKKEFMHGKTKIVISEFTKESKVFPGEEKSYYSIEISVGNRGLITRMEETAGAGMIGAGISDLDRDGNVEIYLFWQTRGSGGFKVLEFFELVGETLIPHHMHGMFNIEITRTHIIHTTPRWIGTDPNCCPTGGKEIITFAFKNDEFVVVQRSIEEDPVWQKKLKYRDEICSVPPTMALGTLGTGIQKDVNGDGKREFIVGGDGFVYVCEQKEGVLTVTERIVIGDRLLDAGLFDINKDGLMDLVVKSSSGAHFMELMILTWRNKKSEVLWDTGSPSGVSFSINARGIAQVEIGIPLTSKKGWSYADEPDREIWTWNGEKFVYTRGKTKHCRIGDLRSDRRNAPCAQCDPCYASDR